MAMDMTVFTLAKAYTYSVDGYGDIVWDIDRALALANAGEIETTIEVDRDQMAVIAARNQYDEARLAEVDPSIPGIAAPVWIPQIDQDASLRACVPRRPAVSRTGTHPRRRAQMPR
jgi:hypothetical protein